MTQDLSLNLELGLWQLVLVILLSLCSFHKSWPMGHRLAQSHQALSLGAGIWIHFLMIAQPPTEPTPQQDVEKLVV